MYEPTYTSPSTNRQLSIFPRQCNFLKVVGLWPLQQTEPELTKFGYFYRSWCIFTIILVLLTCIAQALFIVHNLHDILYFTEGCCTVLMGLHNLIRIIHLFWERRKFKSVIRFFASKIWVSEDDNEVVSRICERESVVIRIISVSLLLLIGMYVILPVVDVVLHPDMVTKPFPYKMWFPFDAQKPVAYVVTYILTSWAGICVVTTLLAEDSIFCYFIIYTCGQFRILKDRIDGLKDGDIVKANGDVLVEGDDIKKDLRGIVGHHNVLISFCNKLEELFSPILLVNFVISSFLICVVGFQIASVKMSLGNLAKLIVYILSALNQLLILCLYGDNLIHHSVGVGDALFFCGWHEWKRPDVTKTLILPLMRSQRPVKITAFKFSVLSLPSFGAILSTSLSYFTLLRTFIESE